MHDVLEEYSCEADLKEEGDNNNNYEQRDYGNCCRT